MHLFKIIIVFYFGFTLNCSAQNILENGFKEHYDSVKQVVLPLIGRKLGILDFEKLQNPEPIFQLTNLLPILNLALISLSFSAGIFIIEIMIFNYFQIIFKRK